MRRIGVTVLCVLAWVCVLRAEAVRVEVGLGGVFPAGGWTRCRISGLTDVAEGGFVVVHVGQVFERSLTVKDGTAEGFILMPDESPMLAIEIPGKGRVDLPFEVTGHLRGVKDRLPVIFLGEDPPDESAVRQALSAGEIFPIRMTPEELAGFAGDASWVHVFALGKMRDDELKQIERAARPFSGTVLVAKPQAVTGWLKGLAFEETEGLSVCNRELARFLPVPRGSVRPELYEIFDPLEWPRSAQRIIAGGFGIILVWAACVVTTRKRALSLVMFAIMSPVAVLGLWVLSGLYFRAGESVHMLERVEGWREGIHTTVTSRAILGRSSFRELVGLNDRIGGISLKDAVPVCYSQRDWTEHKLVMKGDVFVGERPIPSREVSVEVKYDYAPKVSGGLVYTNGKIVFYSDTTPRDPETAGKEEGAGPAIVVQSFAEYLAARQQEDTRVEELRDAMLRYWRSDHFREGLYSIGWAVPGAEERLGVDAGTMVVSRLTGPPPFKPNP